MIRRILRAFGFRRRSSIKLTPKYEAQRLRTIQRAQAMFPNGGRI